MRLFYSFLICFSPIQITTLFLTFLSTFSNSPKTMREIPKNIEFCCKITHNTNTVHERQVFGGWWFLSKVYRAFFSFNGRRFDALLWTEVNLAVRAFFSAGLVAVELRSKSFSGKNLKRVRSKRSAQHGLRSFNVSFHARSSRDHCSYSHRGSRATSQPSHGRTRPSNHYNQTPDTF